MFDENGSYRGDADNDMRLTREEYDASGIVEVLGTSFDDLNILSDDYESEESVDSYEVQEAIKRLMLDSVASNARKEAQFEFQSIVSRDGDLLSREAFVAFREKEGISTAEEANAVYDAITLYSGLESDSQVSVGQFEDYFVLVAVILAEEYLVEQEETYYGRLEGLSAEEVQEEVRIATARLQNDIATDCLRPAGGIVGPPFPKRHTGSAVQSDSSSIATSSVMAALSNSRRHVDDEDAKLSCSACAGLSTYRNHGH